MKNLFGWLACAAFSVSLDAQEYPSKPIRILVRWEKVVKAAGVKVE